MRITFLTPRLPPAVCGVADHTQRLAEALRDEGITAGFVPREAPLPGGDRIEGPINTWDGSVRGLRECVLRQRPDWLWVQLSSYGYSRWGAPWRLARALRDLRAALPTLNVAVCAHETHCQPHQLGRKGFVLSPWQRYTVGTVVRQGDVVFTSIPQYLRQVVRDYGIPEAQVVQLPIGSNVPPVCFSPEARARQRERLGWKCDEVVAVTFGSFGSQLLALQTCGHRLVEGLASGQLQRVVCIGGEGPPLPDLASWADRFGGLNRFQILGNRADREVAEVLACCDFAFSVYPSEQLGKSGTFAAYALMGLVVLIPDISAQASSTPEASLVLSLKSWDWRNGRSPEVERLRRAIRDHAAANLSWSSIARRALGALRNVRKTDAPGSRPAIRRVTGWMERLDRSDVRS